jgi:hypothetical protein
MNAFTVRWTPDASWSAPVATHAGRDVQLLLAFGPSAAPPRQWFAEVRALWPAARLVYCTAGGQIEGADVLDEAVVLIGFAFRRTQVQVLVREQPLETPAALGIRARMRRERDDAAVPMLEAAAFDERAEGAVEGVAQGLVAGADGDRVEAVAEVADALVFKLMSPDTIARIRSTKPLPQIATQPMKEAA